MSGSDPGGSREWPDPPGVGDGQRREEDAGDDRDGSDDRIEPGDPSAEGAAFVLLGVLCSLYVIARLAGLV